jgi:amidophosphoribosyltransferase
VKENSLPSEDTIGHHCGIAYIRLRKDPEYYTEKYADPYFLLNLVYLMLLRQRNRGQDAAGIATAFIPYHSRPDSEYLFKDKMISADPVVDLYKSVLDKDLTGKCIADERAGQVMIGHVLYSTMLSQVDYRYVHPIEKMDAWPTRRIAIAMNGNFANNKEQRDFMRSLGKAPTSLSDMETLAESFGHFLSLAHELLAGPGKSMDQISSDLDLVHVMRRVNRQLKGAYAIEGIVGNGDSFFCRDPFGIRPLFYAKTEEFVIAASEPSAIATTFSTLGLVNDDIQELPPGHIFIVKADGRIQLEQFSDRVESRPCMFEPVYFNRPNNRGTYDTRKRLGADLAIKVHHLLGDLSDTVISYVPNTSLSAALGLYEELLSIQARQQAKEILNLKESGELDAQRLEKILMTRPRFEQTLTKDHKIRTFISQKKDRHQLVATAYDSIEDSARLYYGKRVLEVEDSVVKGTTLERNVIRTLARAGAREIVVVSSCPQIRYPCPYGIEMSTLREFIAFRAAIALVYQRGYEGRLEEIKLATHEQQEKIDADPEFVPLNLVDQIYDLFTYDEISQKIGDLVTPRDMDWEGSVRVIYPDVTEHRRSHNRGMELDTACLDGTYPEKGGLRVLNRALWNYFCDRDERAY